MQANPDPDLDPAKSYFSAANPDDQATRPLQLDETHHTIRATRCSWRVARLRNIPPTCRHFAHSVPVLPALPCPPARLPAHKQGGAGRRTKHDKKQKSPHRDDSHGGGSMEPLPEPGKMHHSRLIRGVRGVPIRLDAPKKGRRWAPSGGARLRALLMLTERGDQPIRVNRGGSSQTEEGFLACKASAFTEA